MKVLSSQCSVRKSKAGGPATLENWGLYTPVQKYHIAGEVGGRRTGDGGLSRFEFVGGSLQGGGPVRSIVVGELGFEGVGSRNREVIGRPDQVLFAIDSQVAARIGPDIALDHDRAVSRFCAGTSERAKGVISVHGAIGVNRELRLLAGRRRDGLLANQEIALRRPAALHAGTDLIGMAEPGLGNCPLALPPADERSEFPGGVLFVCRSSLNSEEKARHGNHERR